MVQTELHRHLDASLRSSTLLKLAQARGLEAQSTSLKSFEEKFFLRTPLKDLNSVLAQFTLFQKVQDRPEVLEQVAFEAVEDCWNEGTRRVELRFSPSFVTEFNSMSWDDVLDAYERGIQRAMKRYPKIEVGLLCIATRDFGVESAEKTVEFYLRNKDRFAGIDLAGNEVDFPCRMFETTFKNAKARGARITVHAGEASGPENVWEAIELLGAERIGHGITSAKDPELLKYLNKKKICLEVCPTSNWITQSVASLEKHPLAVLIRAGVPTSINTDDPGIFGVTLPQEYDIARKKIGLSEKEIAFCLDSAFRSSFLNK